MSHTIHDGLSIILNNAEGVKDETILGVSKEKFIAVVGFAADRMKPVQFDPEGGGRSWFLVCSECHTSINPNDKYCRECGRPIERV